MKEADLDKHLLRSMKGTLHLSIKLSMMSYMGSAGWPDRLFIFPGPTFIFIELKTDRGRLTKRQQMRINLLRHFDCEVLVLYGKGQVDEWVTRTKQRFHNRQP